MPRNRDRRSDIVHPSIETEVDGLSGYVGIAVGAIVGIAVVNTVLMVGYIAAVRGGSPDVSAGVQFVVAGLGLVVPAAILWWWFDADDRSTAFPFRSPTRTEVGWALAFVPLGLAASALAIDAASGLGVGYRAPGYDLTDPVTAFGVLVGPLLLAPLLEEALFRGVLLGSLIDRGWSPWFAGLAAILVFAAGHYRLGLAGVVGLAVWAVFPTVLRLRFNNLSGAVLLHFLHNVAVYVVFVALSL